jgi:hypothetical protein
MRPRLVTGIMAVMFSSSVALIVGCGDQGPMTYRVWSDTHTVRVIQFDKATTPEATLNEWDAKGVHWRQDKDHYYVEETDISKTSENVAFNTVATPFTVVMDGVTLTICVLAAGGPGVDTGAIGNSVGAAPGTKMVTGEAIVGGTTIAARTAIAAANGEFHSPNPVPTGKPQVKPPIRVIVFAKSTTPESETKRWTDAGMRWFADDTRYFVPVTDIGKIVQDVRFRALSKPLAVTVESKRLEAVTEATPQ